MMAFSWTPSRKLRLPTVRQGRCVIPATIRRCGLSCIVNGRRTSIEAARSVMANKSTAIGAFVFGALALGVIAILTFAGTGWFTPRLRVVAFFQDSVAGLTVGSPVALRGVRVGSVQSLKVYVKLPDMVPV